MLATACLLALVLGGSALVWQHLVRKWLIGQPFLEVNEENRSRWRSAPELAVAYVGLFWLVAHLLPQFSDASTSPRTPLDRSTVAASAAFNLGLVLILPFALVSGTRSWSEIGLTVSKPLEQLKIGWRGFLAAALPMAISMAVTLPLRSPESQHSLLKMLVESPDVTTVMLITVTAVLSAPLLEELLFRVILQGWLTTLVPPSVAISVVAMMFALVHGWRDGLALLPLAFVLGYVFHRRHSYFAVVAIHGLFNATMLTLQLLNPRN